MPVYCLVKKETAWMDVAGAPWCYKWIGLDWLGYYPCGVRYRAPYGVKNGITDACSTAEILRLPQTCLQNMPQTCPRIRPTKLISTVFLKRVCSSVRTTTCPPSAEEPAGAAVNQTSAQPPSAALLCLWEGGGFEPSSGGRYTSAERPQSVM